MTFTSDKLVSFRDLILERYVITQDDDSQTVSYLIKSDRLSINIDTDNADEALILYSRYLHQLKTIKQTHRNGNFSKNRRR